MEKEALSRWSQVGKGQSCFQDMGVHRGHTEETWASGDPGREGPGDHLGLSSGH